MRTHSMLMSASVFETETSSFSDGKEADRPVLRRVESRMQQVVFDSVLGNTMYFGYLGTDFGYFENNLSYKRLITKG